MRRYFIFFSYDGTAYHGWQRQPNASSVQQSLEEALTRILRREVSVTGAGRTDTGVHARMMAAHLDWEPSQEQQVEDALDVLALKDKLNRLLPPDIAVNRILEVDPELHARFSATARRYEYTVILRKDPFLNSHAMRLFRRPDFELMNKAAARLLEVEDFTSFAKLHADTKTNICHVTRAEWREQTDGVWIFTIQADRFLRNMVRAIVGTLLDVGMGKLTLDGLEEVINDRNRCSAGMSVPAQGLSLVDITYPGLECMIP